MNSRQAEPSFRFNTLEPSTLTATWSNHVSNDHPHTEPEIMAHSKDVQLAFESVGQQGDDTRSLGMGYRVPPAAEPRTVLFIVWPEPGHVAAPLALAAQLRARGDRAVFAGAPNIGEQIRGAGYEFSDLSSSRDDPTERPTYSVFSKMPGRWALEKAIDCLIVAFESTVRQYRPSLVLIDSLYSALGLLADAAGLRWAQMETDLPRELDPAVPPPSSMLVPRDTPHSRRAIREAWTKALSDTRRRRQASRRWPIFYAWSMDSYFPDAFVRALGRRLGRRVRFDRACLLAPVARAPRIVFCPPEFDFPRVRKVHASSTIWLGPCIDETRREPAFPWSALPGDKPLAYCAFGTQSLRNPVAPEVLRAIVEAFSRRSDFFLVVSCPPAHAARLTIDSRRVLVVPFAPQMALLRRARLALTHGGFNTIKECVLLGVPMIAIPLSHDQPRNAALVSYHGLGLALDTARVTASVIDAAVSTIHCSAEIWAQCLHMKGIFESSQHTGAALQHIDSLLGESLTKARQS